MGNHSISCGDFQYASQQELPIVWHDGKFLQQCGKDGKEHDIAADFNEEEGAGGYFRINDFRKWKIARRFLCAAGHRFFCIATPSGGEQGKTKAAQQGGEQDEKIEKVFPGIHVERVSRYEKEDEHWTRVICKSCKKKGALFGQGTVCVELTGDFGADGISGEDARGK